MKLRLPFVKSGPRVAVIRLSGAIGMPGRASLTANALIPVLDKAFVSGKPDAVALEINSPGGSPVQSSLIAARIRDLSEEHNVPVHAFVEDVAASGGYWLASAADRIWCDASSIVGSIGVVSAGFGAHEFISRHGLERRVYTAGRSKSQLDPFKPESAEDVARLNSLLGELHETFIAHVKARRGTKLTDETDLFTGEFWLARQAEAFGLIDGIAHLKPKMREIFGDKVTFRRHAIKRPLWSRFGASVVEHAVAGIEERAAFARFGL